MAGTFKGLNQSQIDKRLKEGRGQGTGSGYKPFIYTRDVSSLGRSHRVFGHKCQRMHHLLSDLELAVFFTLDWSEKVLDIREQFPLSVEHTVQIAKDLEIRHAQYKSVSQVLSSDFLVDLNTPQRQLIAFQVKYSQDLSNPNVIERLMLEKAYWDKKGVHWAVITEKEVSKAAFINIQWLYPAHTERDIDLKLLHHYYDLFAYEFAQSPDQYVTEIAQRVDINYKQKAGQALYWLRQLLAKRLFLFNINSSYRLLKADMLQGNYFDLTEEILYASN